jgi:hypothetical protein
VTDSQSAAKAERAEKARLTRILRFADLVALLLVLATSLQAFAAWRIYLVIEQMLRVSDRPYLGVQHVALDLSDPQAPKVVVEYRNYGPVAAENVVLQDWTTIDGKPTAGQDPDEKIQLGVVSPSVPHFSYSLLRPADIGAILEGKSSLITVVKFSYSDPSGDGFCYGMHFHYDRFLRGFQVAGGSTRCEAGPSL